MAILTGYHIRLTVLPYGDHTFVLSDDGHAWGCFGDCTDGQPLRSGQGDSSVANCLSQPINTGVFPPEYAGMRYAIDGVCHQAADSILSIAGVTVEGAEGWHFTRWLYGVCGHNWPQRRARCVVGAAAVAEPEDRAAHHRHLMADFAEAVKAPTGAEPDHYAAAVAAHERMLAAKAALDQRFEAGGLDFATYAADLQALVDDSVSAFGAAVPADEFVRLFGFPAGQRYQILDPAVVGA
jgi:hypothetical protein